MRRVAVGVVVFALSGVAARAGEPGERSTAADSRVQVVDFREDAVLALTGFVGYQIHLALAVPEPLLSIAAGDTTAVEIGSVADERDGPHLLIKPRRANVHTNLTVLTSRHVYLIDYRSVATPPELVPPERVVWSVRYRYAEDAQSIEPKTGDAAGAEVQRVTRNSAYARCGGARALQPLAVWDDGARTHLEFGAREALPAVLVRGDDDQESLANFHVEGGALVVDRIAARWSLRRGRQVACLKNMAYAVAPGSAP